MTNDAAVIAIKISTTVKKRRKILRLSQEAMADKAGIDRTYASQIERGIANPSLFVLCSIAKALDISFMQLVNGDIQCTFGDKAPTV
ncbi:helix-turn-helix transcriptional regulator [Limnohabitans sp. B9-3]|uniref:helix-turn-helix domain-containing protein n=1 Tax=Limnohabitans sp. B9-3 TaxID=1100707 RepID=UPI0018EDF36B